MNILKTMSFLLLTFTFTACAQDKKGSSHNYKSPPGYNLNQPIRMDMPGALREISGIAFHQGNKDTLYAEQDEEGKVYYMDLNTQQHGNLAFGKHGDYEDIAICDEEVLLLRSDGVLFGMPFNEVQHRDIRTVSKWENLVPAGEYEGLYADNGSGRIYILCKSCKSDKNKDHVSGYIFQKTPGKPEPVGTFSISEKEIARLATGKKNNFKPAALAKNQDTGEWYILSSVNKMLVITDEHWNVKAVFRLDPELFTQPEGIAFDNDHTLYIANEGSDIKPGTILKFVFRPLK